MFGARRWCFTICALFMLCPRRFQVDANNLVKRTNNNLLAPRWAMSSVARDKTGTTKTLEEAELGFDLNNDEIKKFKIWPGGIIPYFIDVYSFDEILRDRLRSFLEETNAITGLNFVELHQPPRNLTARWVFFINRQGLLSCANHPFKKFTIEGVQKIVLGYDCLVTGGELADTILALVGVPPQHNAPNRDKYIKIIYENIIPEKSELFEKLPDSEWLFHDVDYDFASAGHYPLHKYTVNGKATIDTLQNPEIAIGEGNGFSNIDIWKIRMLYNYISKRRLKLASLADCNKIFNLDTNVTEGSKLYASEEDIQPRKKPNKYLGLPEETSQLSSKDVEISNEKNTNINNDTLFKEESEKENQEEGAVSGFDLSKEDLSENEKNSDETKTANKSVRSKDYNVRQKKIRNIHKPTNTGDISIQTNFKFDGRYTKQANKKLRFVKPTKRFRKLNI